MNRHLLPTRPGSTTHHHRVTQRHRHRGQAEVSTQQPRETETPRGCCIWRIAIGLHAPRITLRNSSEPVPHFKLPTPARAPLGTFSSPVPHFPFQPIPHFPAGSLQESGLNSSHSGLRAEPPLPWKFTCRGPTSPSSRAEAPLPPSSRGRGPTSASSRGRGPTSSQVRTPRPHRRLRCIRVPLHKRTAYRCVRVPRFS